MKLRGAAPILGFLLVSAVNGGCQPHGGDGSVTMLPTTRMKIGSGLFTLEKAVTEGQQERGLMRRDSMPADHGMIFPFMEEGPRQFWNHNVRFPLDLLFVDRFGRVVAMMRMEAYDDTPTKTAQAKYAIELNAGAAAASGVKLGDKLELPADVVKP